MKRASAKSLVAAFAFFKANPNGKINTGDWTKPTWTFAEFRAWFRDCLEAKINSQDSRFPTGRKAGGEYAVELMRLSNYVGNRIIIDWISPVLGSRVRDALAGRLRCNNLD